METADQWSHGGGTPPLLAYPPGTPPGSPPPQPRTPHFPPDLPDFPRGTPEIRRDTPAPPPGPSVLGSASPEFWRRTPDFPPRTPGIPLRVAGSSGVRRTSRHVRRNPPARTPALPIPATPPPSANGATSLSPRQRLGNHAPHEFLSLKGPNIVTLQATAWSDAVFPSRWPGLRIGRPFGPPVWACGGGGWKFRVPAMLPASQHDSPTGAARPGRTLSASGSRPRRRTGGKSPSRTDGVCMREGEATESDENCSAPGTPRGSCRSL